MLGATVGTGPLGARVLPDGALVGDLVEATVGLKVVKISVGEVEGE